MANQATFEWEEEHEECFKEVKKILSSLPIMMPPNPKDAYYLTPSVGLNAIGAILMQKDKASSYVRPIYFSSKVLTEAEKSYTDIEQLMFVIMFAVRKFRSYLLPKAFIILTLEHNLPYAVQYMSISPRISKWVLELQEYQYSFIVEDSTRASLADVLTYKVREKKVTKVREDKPSSPQQDLEEAHTLYFDGAYRRQIDKAARGILILSPSKEVMVKKGIILKNVHSNNEAE